MWNYDGLDTCGDLNGHHIQYPMSNWRSQTVVQCAQVLFDSQAMNQTSSLLYPRVVHHLHLSMTFNCNAKDISRGLKRTYIHLLDPIIKLFHHLERTFLVLPRREHFHLHEWSADALSIFLIRPLNLYALWSHNRLESDDEYSQSHRGMYEQTYSNQRHARRRGMGYFCREWHT